MFGPPLRFLNFLLFFIFLRLLSYFSTLSGKICLLFFRDKSFENDIVGKRFYSVGGVLIGYRPADYAFATGFTFL